MNIWKVSHGGNIFNDQEILDLLGKKMVMVHKNTKAKGTSAVTQGDSFNNVSKGDLFYLCNGNKKVLLVGRFKGEKIVDADGWISQKYDLIWNSIQKSAYSGEKKWWAPNDNSTFIEIPERDYPLFEKNILIPYFKKTMDELKKTINNMNQFEQLEINKTLLTVNHNLILTGAPGTGKTYLAKQIAQQMIFGEIKEEMTPDEEKQFNEQCGLVQFHPSYDYTDFVEGLRPIPNGLGSVGFELRNGVFKDFCTKALQNFEDSKKTQQVLVEQQSFEDKYNEVVNKINDGSITEFELKTAGMKMEVADVSNRNSIILRTPGTTTNRTYTVSFKRIAVLAKAYPDVASLENMSNIYDSIQGVIKGCNASAYWAVLKEVYKRSESGAIEDTQQGGEKELQQEVKEKPFVFIIDEINRGEISKIFGELFFSIDPGYRGKDGEVRTQYANMQKEEANDFDDVLGITDPENYGHFFVPENVYIIGTMNDIDRSVESMDFAFRRRFAFKEIKAKDTQTMLDNEKAWGKDSAGNYTLRPDQTIIDEIKKKMESLNNTIWNEDNKTGLEGLSAAYHIGASYFLKLVNYKKEDGSFDYDKLWKYHLEGLLRDYLRGMQDVEINIDKLKRAYGYSAESSNYEASNN